MNRERIFFFIVFNYNYYKKTNTIKYFICVFSMKLSCKTYIYIYSSIFFFFFNNNITHWHSSCVIDTISIKSYGSCFQHKIYTHFSVFPCGRDDRRKCTTKVKDQLGSSWRQIRPKVIFSNATSARVTHLYTVQRVVRFCQRFIHIL